MNQNSSTRHIQRITDEIINWTDKSKITQINSKLKTSATQRVNLLNLQIKIKYAVIQRQAKGDIPSTHV